MDRVLEGQAQALVKMLTLLVLPTGIGPEMYPGMKLTNQNHLVLLMGLVYLVEGSCRRRMYQDSTPTHQVGIGHEANLPMARWVKAPPGLTLDLTILQALVHCKERVVLMKLTLLPGIGIATNPQRDYHHQHLSTL